METVLRQCSLLYQAGLLTIFSEQSVSAWLDVLPYLFSLTEGKLSQFFTNQDALDISLKCIIMQFTKYVSISLEVCIIAGVNQSSCNL